MIKKVLILGAGLIGRPMAIDLAEDKTHKFNVGVVDIKDKALLGLKEYQIETIKKDLSKPENIRKVIKNYDIIVNSVPGFMGFKTLKTIIESGKNVVDIAFFPEDPLTLNELAVRKKVTAIVDCGVAPGMSNLMVGYVNEMLSSTSKVEIYVGGLPEKRVWPYEYKAVFSPVDVIEEYMRPARIVENGKIVTKPALSEPEIIDFPEVGTLEAFNTDGLRTLVKTMNIPEMKEKTLRYPGHIDKIKVLRNTGFFNKEFINVNKCKIRPIDFTSKLLFPIWKLNDEDIDITVMRIIVEGIKKNRKVSYIYNMFDKYDLSTSTHSMARTTGYTATSMVRLLNKGLFDKQGVYPLELIGCNERCVNYMLEQLRKKNINYNRGIKYPK